MSTLFKKVMRLNISGEFFYCKEALFMFSEVSKLNSGAILK